VGADLAGRAPRAFLALAVVMVVATSLPNVRASAAPEATLPDAPRALRLQRVELQDPDRPGVERFVDPDARVGITPPAGWVRSPESALNPVSDPPEPVQELARFQAHVTNAALYETPVPLTSGLLQDATAVISIGVAREGSGILAIERAVRGTREVGTVPGFTVLEDEAVYDGLHLLTRYLFSRSSGRVLVVRAAVAETAWTGLGDIIRSSVATFAGDPIGENAPAPAPPAPPAPPPPPPADETLAIRERIIARAASVLGLRYVWGGNSTANGMDCSAYVSWTWGVSRYTTDSIWNVSFPITKADLRPGDALNLTIGRDPARKGHIRIFEAWANSERTAMWVYEETPPRVVHRVIAYDDRYQPIRLAGLSGAGEARVVPGTPAPTRTVAPAPRRTPTPTARRTPSPTPRRASATPVPWPSWFASWTPKPTVSPTATPVRTPTATPPASPTPLRTPTPAPSRTP
jgi:hypothetical protein